MIRKFYQNHYPHVGKIFPTIDIHEFAGLEELYRAVLFTLRPSLSANAARTSLNAFAVANVAEKRRQIADLPQLAPGGSRGSVSGRSGRYQITDSGELQPEILSVISLLDMRPHPPVAIISRRNVPYRYRPNVPDVAFVGVGSLSNAEAVRLVSSLLKQADIMARNDPASRFFLSILEIITPSTTIEF